MWVSDVACGDTQVDARGVVRDTLRQCCGDDVML